MGAIALGSPRLIQNVFRCALPDFLDSNLTFTCFGCAGVTEKYCCLNIFPSSLTRTSWISGIEFLGLTKTGLSAIDGEQLASSLAASSSSLQR